MTIALHARRKRVKHPDVKVYNGNGSRKPANQRKVVSRSGSLECPDAMRSVGRPDAPQPGCINPPGYVGQALGRPRTRRPLEQSGSP
jgi:hypothetical protein